MTNWPFYLNCVTPEVSVVTSLSKILAVSKRPYPVYTFKADACCTAAAGTVMGNSRPAPQPRRVRAVEWVPAGCQCTHANGDSGRKLLQAATTASCYWALCQLEMSEIKALFPPQWCVTHCDYAEIIIIMGLVDSLDYNYAIFASNAVSLESKKHLLSPQLLTFWWIFVGDGLTIRLMVLQKVSQRNVRVLECANRSQPTLVHNFCASIHCIFIHGLQPRCFCWW